MCVSHGRSYRYDNIKNTVSIHILIFYIRKKTAVHKIFDNYYLNYNVSNHVLAMSSKRKYRFDRNPGDVNVAMFVDILLVIGCLTVFLFNC